MYQVKLTDGTELILSVDDMVAKGYAIAKDSSIEDLWENDAAEGYEYLPAADISAKGVAKIERRQVVNRKFYCIFYRSGKMMTASAGDMYRQGLLKKNMKPIPVPDADQPWPEHGSMYDKDAMGRRKVMKVELVDDGEHKYKITAELSDGSVKEVVANGTYMRLMGYIK